MVCPVESTTRYKNRIAAFDLDVRLIQSPTCWFGFKCPATALIHFRAVDLNPPPHATSIYQQPTFSHHLCDVPET